MALWKDSNAATSTPTPAPSPISNVPPVARDVTPPAREPERASVSSVDAARRPKETAMKESVIAPELAIEGKIVGAGHVRVAGRFKGNVNVKGELTIEPGATIDGEVKADTVLVGGEVRGHLIANSRVEFKESGTLIGDLKAGSLTVAAGSKMRGKVEFGWKEGEVEALHPPESKTPAH